MLSYWSGLKVELILFFLSDNYRNLICVRNDVQ